jgi:hypothetical protein
MEMCRPPELLKTKSQFLAGVGSFSIMCISGSLLRIVLVRR